MTTVNKPDELVIWHWFCSFKIEQSKYIHSCFVSKWADFNLPPLILILFYYTSNVSSLIEWTPLNNIFLFWKISIRKSNGFQKNFSVLWAIRFGVKLRQINPRPKAKLLLLQILMGKQNLSLRVGDRRTRPRYSTLSVQVCHIVREYALVMYWSC